MKTMNITTLRFWSFIAIGAIALVSFGALVVSSPLAVARAQTASSTPAVSDIAATSSPSGTSAAISWKTNIPASSQVKYGTTTNYGIFSAYYNNMATTSHALTLAGLMPNTMYHFEALSGISSSTATSTSSMATSSSPDQTFTTSYTAASSTAPSYCNTGHTTEGYFVSSNAASYASGQTVHFCLLDNTRTPLFLTGTHPWQIKNASGTLVYMPPAGTLASTTGTSFFTDSWNQSASSTASTTKKVLPGNYDIVFPGFPGAPFASFTILPGATSTATSTISTTTPSVDMLIGQLQNLQALFPQFFSQIQGIINEVLRNTGNTTATSSTTQISGSEWVNQNGQTFPAGGTIDFGGHNFGHEEQITLTLKGQTVTTAHADGGGNFTTGSLSLPATPGTYTYMFTQPNGTTAQATIYVQ